MKLRKLLVGAFVSVATFASAQQMPPIPADPSYRIGKLDNGLTYYIRHNEYPEHVANFYIAQRVGSIQENDDQRGLAHFLEHMAFNGSTHFKDNGIIDFTRSLGVSFGGDLNAYTSVEETVYRICNVPTARQSALDSCMLVLQDWSNGLLLLPEEIDKERGVVHGEWAMRNSAIQRLFEKNLPLMYPDCKYGYRMPIGTMEVVDNFTPEALRKYYQKWYHPENQAIIVIGDVDVDHMEQVIKQDFSDIKPSAEAAHVEPVAVPDNNSAIYIFDKDNEMQYTYIGIDLKSEAMPREMKGTMAEYFQNYVATLTTMMFNSRMSELSQQEDCPFVQLSMSYGNYALSSTVEAFDISCISKEGKDMESLKAAVREVNRVKKFGFTGSEFNRAKEEFLSQAEKAYSNRDKRKNVELYDQCVANYLKGEAMPDPEMEYQLWQGLSKQIPLEVINQTMQEALTIDNDTNFVCSMFAQEKDGATYPTTDDMRKAVEETRAENITAWVDNAKDEPLISTMPKAGKIKKETKNDALGYTELQLSNGAKVILKKTDYKDNEVLLSGFAEGGQSQYAEADYTNLKMFSDVASSFGLGNFTNNELEKALAGKQADVNISLGKRYATISGHSTPKDLETMMQLLYLNFTAVKKDEKAYNTLMQQYETVLKNRDLRPETQFNDSVMARLYNHNARFSNVVASDLANVNADRIVEIAKENFSNANNFTFTIIGNFDEQQTRQLICQYIASLPGKGKAVKAKDIRTFFSGYDDCQFKRKMETPKPYIFEMYKADDTNTLQNNVLCDMTGEVLTMMLLKSVREDAGAAYSVGSGANLSSTPEKTYALLQIIAPISAPEKIDSALIIIDQQVKELSVSADPDKVTKVKANLLKQADVNAKTNGYWQGIIESYLIEGLDKHTDYKQIVESVTPEMISNYLKNVILKGNNRLNVVMRPE